MQFFLLMCKFSSVELHFPGILENTRDLDAFALLTYSTLVAYTSTTNYDSWIVTLLSKDVVEDEAGNLKYVWFDEIDYDLWNFDVTLAK